MNFALRLSYCLGMLLALNAAQAQYINLRMSIKIIVDPYRGQPPQGVTRQVFSNAVAAANQWMATYYRGYRFELVEVVNIGGPSEGGTSGPSKWFGVDPRDANNVLWSQFQADARTNALYLRRTNAINFYASTPTNWNAGGAAPFPSEAAYGWLVGWAQVNEGAFWIVHETGHYFGLGHTHGGCGCPSTSGCFLSNGYWVGDDGIADTLAESSGDYCMTNIDQITLANFNKFYTNCWLNEQYLAIDTFSNVMSYHDPWHKDLYINRMTELQADTHTSYANSDRAPVTSGRTRFVSTSGSDTYSGLAPTSPKRTVLNAANASSASGGDLILLRPGSYNEKITISTPVTLRAMRSTVLNNRWATIGKP